MNPVRRIPTESELNAHVGQLSSREVLGAHEAITLIQTIAVPLLMRSDHDCGNLSAYAGECAVVSAQEELGRLIRLEERSLQQSAVSLAEEDRPEWPGIRAAGVKLMRLIAEMRIHNDIAIV